MARPTLPRMDARRGKFSTKKNPHYSQNHNLTLMQEIQEATASEPLSIEEEYSMQRRWRLDADKLTFIACQPISTANLTAESDSPSNMIGDINLFLRIDDGADGLSPPEIVGEIELMIAEKSNQRRGFGKAALLAFMKYIAERQELICGEFVGSLDEEMKGKLEDRAEKFACLSVKIGKENERSLNLFEGLGFVKVEEEPNFFGEFELRRADLEVEEAMKEAGVEGYKEVVYERKE